MVGDKRMGGTYLQKVQHRFERLLKTTYSYLVPFSFISEPTQKRKRTRQEQAHLEITHCSGCSGLGVIYVDVS
jgi:hypothetical protein